MKHPKPSPTPPTVRKKTPQVSLLEAQRKISEERPISATAPSADSAASVVKKRGRPLGVKDKVPRKKKRVDDAPEAEGRAKEVTIDTIAGGNGKSESLASERERKGPPSTSDKEPPLRFKKRSSGTAENTRPVATPGIQDAAKVTDDGPGRKY